jgi:hypothetical protein
MFSSFWSRKGNGLRRARPTPRSRRFRPFVEPLEERWLPATTFTVNTTGDSPFIIFNPDGTTLTSLRAAINEVNGDTSDSATSPDTIAFSIPQPSSGPVVQTINVGATGNGPLPKITRPAIINGITETGHAPGFSFSPLIELNGAGAGAGANGLWITAGNSAVFELAINRFNAAGIRLDGGGSNHIGGDFIGTDPTGAVAEGNGQGILITNGSSGNALGPQSAENLISGNLGDGIEISGRNTTANQVGLSVIGTDLSGEMPLPNQGDGVAIDSGAHDNQVFDNEISGNAGNGVVLNTGATNNVVRNNFIGIDAKGTVGLGNGNDGVLVENGAFGNTIGGSDSFDPTRGFFVSRRNVVSGNTNAGVLIIQASGNYVQGNYIGTDLTGKVAIPNDPSGTLADGVDLLDGATNNVIGGASSRDTNGNLIGMGNLISGNGFDGVFIANYFGGGAATGNVVQGNFIGTDVTGTQKLPNQGSGVHLEGGAIGNIIGGIGLGNIISGNGTDAAATHTQFPIVGAGVQIADFFGTGPDQGNTVAGNYIGTDATGSQRLGNLFEGVFLQQGVVNNTVGPGNVISANGGHGVDLSGAGTTGNVVAGDYIGTDAGGSKALGNIDSGVIIWRGASGNRVGGPGAGNVLSGNGIDGINVQGSTTAGNVIESNLIGTDAAGKHALANARSGVYLTYDTHGNRIGTDGDGINDPAERNVLSGNTRDGVTLDHASNNIVAGNYIGTDIAGTAALPNGGSGVYVYRSQGDRIGTQSGDADGAGERNVISGNIQAGVTIDGPDARNNVVAGNFIGPNATGAAGLFTSTLAGNGVGIRLINGANDNTIGGPAPGAGNVISGNSGDGLDIRGNGLLAGAVADYRAEGDASDALGFNYGIIQGNVGFEPGRFGQAFHFDGATGEGVNIPASPSLNVGAGGGLTLAAWINPDDVSSGEPIIEWTNGVHLWFSVTFGGAQGPGNLYANIQDTAGNGHIISTAPGLILPHRWQFVALTYDQLSGVATLYVNGGIFAQQYLGSFTPNTTGDMNLGHRVPGSFSGSGQFAGGMDEVSIYNRALSDGEILFLHFANGIGVNQVFGNRIGTALDPAVRLANGGDGLVIADSAGNVVGGNTAVFGPGTGADLPGNNVVAGNFGRGIYITGAGAFGNQVQGNFIGTDITGTIRQGNASDGLRISEGASDNSNPDNVIAYNRGSGVVIGNGLNDPAETDGVFAGRIYGNAQLGIDLGNDGVTPNTTPSFTAPNGLANFPVITSARSAGSVTVISATVHSFPNSILNFVEFYADSSLDPTGYGQGETFLGQAVNVQLNGNGDGQVTMSFPINLTGLVVTATAFTGAGSSEFGRDVAVTPLVPTLTGLSPSSTTEGPLTLTVNGSDFVQGAVVSVNGTPLATTFISGTKLTAAVPAGLLEEGSASVTVANPAPGGGTSNAMPLTITDASLSVTGSAITATGSALFSGVVATFSDTGGSEPAGSYTALINWGDGSSSPGTVVPAGSAFNVVGSHTYLSSGSYTTTVDVSDEGGSTASGSGSAAVAHVPLTVFAQNVSLVEGASSQVVLGLFSDPDPRDAGSDFAVTITWGDGKTSAGTVSPVVGGLFQVTGNHAYAEEGNYPVAISIQDDRGAFAGIMSAAAVTDALLTPTPVTLTVTGNKNFTGIVGLFTDADPAGTATDYTATVTWDDGSTSAGVVSGSGPFVVTTAHKFATFKGPHTIVVSVADAGGATAAITDTVIDPPARHATPPHVDVILKAAGTPSITVASSSLTAGVLFRLTVTVEDAYGNIVRSFMGAIHFTSTDETARLPKDYTFQRVSKSVHTFGGLVLHKRGIQSISITDPLDSSVTASVIVDVV